MDSPKNLEEAEKYAMDEPQTGFLPTHGDSSRRPQRHLKMFYVCVQKKKNFDEEMRRRQNAFQENLHCDYFINSFLNCLQKCTLYCTLYPHDPYSYYKCFITWQHYTVLQFTNHNTSLDTALHTLMAETVKPLSHLSFRTRG